MSSARSAKSKFTLITVFIGVLIGILVIILFTPSSRQYSIANREYKGFYELYVKSRPIVIYSHDELSNYDPVDTLLILTRVNYTSDLRVLGKFIERGGVLVTYGPPRYLVELLLVMGLNGEFKGYVNDFVFNKETSNNIVINTTKCGELVLGDAYTLDIYTEHGENTHYSSIFSYIDLNNNEFYDLGEPIGRVPVLFNITIGNGYVLIISAERFLDNDLFKYNSYFIECISSNRVILLDQVEASRDPIEAFRIMIDRVFIYMPLVYVLIAILGVIAYVVYRELL